MTVRAESDFADDILGSLDGGELNGLIAGLTDEQYDLFGGRDFVSVVSGILSGDLRLDFSDVLSFVLSAVGSSLSSLAALLASVVGIAVVCSATGAFGGGRTEGIRKAVHFAAAACITVVAGIAAMSMFVMCADTLSALSAQINVLAPLLLTLMAGTGGTNTASVFSPTVSVLTSGLFNLISSVLMPMLIAAFVFGAIAGITGEDGLGKMSSFMRRSVKWLFGTGFFLLSAVMSVQGITASVFDGLSVRGAKFAIGKYVPVIGGYMSDGFNLIVSGGIAVRNALGYAALLLLLLTILPAVMQIAVFALCLKLAAALTEPLGGGVIGGVLQNMGKTASLAGGVMFGAGFLHFVFVLILMAAGNVFI